MLFSFIVPVYNTSQYLERCIKSILCQKGADFEILLIDDGSTDNSGEMCDQYAKQYPDIVRVIHKENEGLLLTRRRGFREAKGDWFINVDSDDYIALDLLESVVSAIDRYHPDMVMYNFQYFTDVGEVLPSRIAIADRTVFTDDNKEQLYSFRLLSDDINNMWSKALKREIVDIEIDYSDSGIRNMCEDAIQVLPLFTNAKRILYLHKPLYYYRKGQNSITASRTYESWMESKICFLFTEKYLRKWNVTNELQQRFYTRYTEYLTNFLRWIFDQNEQLLPKPLNTIIHQISIDPAFKRCLKMYQKRYAKTAYLKLCIPIIIKNVLKENVKGLKRYFFIEKKIRKHID